MRVVFIHCHYERGGVTQVVENQVHALDSVSNAGQPVLLSGGRVGGLSDATRAVALIENLRELEYDSVLLPDGEVQQRSAHLADQIAAKLRSIGGGPEDCVLHWHNHSLGKNNAAPGAIRKLAALGWRLLLQVHDFAEDNRPTNYAGIIRDSGAQSKSDVDRFLYPVARQIHYAALTRTDSSVFKELGIEDRRIHWLPNTISMADQDVDRETSLNKLRSALNLPTGAQWSLYPVRGIRRKNVGEFLLLSHLLPEDIYAGITLAPKNPIERASYDRWKNAAQSLAPKAVFDAGLSDQVSFQENVAASQFVLSTSVAEGFGMVFLEPWLADRPVIARDLPTVTSDFIESGIQFPGLYKSIRVPGDRQWISDGTKELISAETDAWSEVASEFRPAVQSPGEENDTIDFAKLTPQRQLEVLKRINCDSGFESDLKILSRELIDSFAGKIQNELIQANREIAMTAYSPDHQSQALLELYQSVIESELGTEIAEPVGGPAIDYISRLRPFYPCRTERTESLA